MSDNPTKPSASKKLKLANLLRSHKRGLTIAFVAVLGETLTDVLQPWPIKIIVDNIIQNKKLPKWLGGIVSGYFGHNKLSILNFAVAAVAAIAILGAVSSYIEKYMTTSVGQWIAHDLRRTLYNHIQRLSLAEHDETRTGDLISRVTDDIDAVQSFINSALLGIVVDVLTLVGMMGVMFYVNWKFTLIALSVVPALFAVVYYLTRRIKRASRAVRKSESELTSIVEEALTSVRVVKAFAREDYEMQKFESESLENVETALRARSLKATLAPLVEVIVAIGTCLVLWDGARLALDGRISAGVLIVFLLYLGNMYKPMRDLSKQTDTVSKALVGYERIQEVLEIESQVRDLPRARRAPRFKGTIEFDHVHFSYHGETPVLKDVSFRIEAGQVAALVGPSGQGKTTISSLIPRFYDPTSGTVKIDGSDIRDFKLRSLREQMSFVLQETLLFRATVWDNIAYGKPDAKPKAIIRAAQLANAEEFIETLPQGYSTVIGERGASLSGGQRQRIAIARAIIRNTPILIFDEPTSGLDAAAEQTVMEALNRLMEGRTTVLVAHHLSTIRRAEVIFVIGDAEIVEHGSHEELLAANGPYAELYRIQTESVTK
ncbi:MAG TPA: ABC transporter ATP-binding protein [Verrucomicrobiae bacterium]|nr:ABC transporter ATP-binding protein [Verrucomicrobiae bacterium]